MWFGWWNEQPRPFVSSPMRSAGGCQQWPEVGHTFLPPYPMRHCLRCRIDRQDTHDDGLPGVYSCRGEEEGKCIVFTYSCPAREEGKCIGVYTYREECQLWVFCKSHSS